MLNLTYLSDVIGPRLTGSDNLKKANEWAAEKMRSYGLSNVRMEPWTIPIGWQRGTATAKLIEPDNGRTLTVAAMGWTPSTKGPIEGDVVILRARTRDDLAKYKGKLKNAIILQGQPANVRPITDLSRHSWNGPRASPRRERGGRRKSTGRGRHCPACRWRSSTCFWRRRSSGFGWHSARRGGAPPATGGNRPGSGRDAPNGFDRFGDRSAMMQFRRELSEFLRSEGAAVLVQDAGKPHGLLNMTGGCGDRGGDRGMPPNR